MGFVDGDFVDVVERKAALDGDDVELVGFFNEHSFVYFEIREGDLDCIADIAVDVADRFL